MKFLCVYCGKEFSITESGPGLFNCLNCNFQYHYSDNYLKYEFDEILFRKFRQKYLLYKVLNNNGYLSYEFLKEGSLSLPGRREVQNFKRYIELHIKSGILLDAGCGILPIPGYLNFEDRTRYVFYGLDPIDDDKFEGIRIVGCSEFTPFPDNHFNAIIFATSLDHVCSLDDTIKESYRILAHKGKVLIWMSDRNVPFLHKMKIWIDKIINGFKNLNGKDRFSELPKDCIFYKRFAIYPNGTILYIPKGAVDPFHSFRETPNYISDLFVKNGFKHTDIEYRDNQEVFLCFSKYI